VELAPAFEPRYTSDSGSKLHALHTLRETRPHLVLRLCNLSVFPEKSAHKNNILGETIQRAGLQTDLSDVALRTGAPYLGGSGTDCKTAAGGLDFECSL